MDKEKTVRFLTETPLSVIACADDAVLQDFLKRLSIEYGKPIAECAVDEIDKVDLSRAGIVIVRGIRNGHSEQKLQIAQKLTAIKDIAKAHNAHFIVPLEQIDCEPYLVTAQLRGIWLRIPEDKQSEINMFNLHCNSDDFKLECEIGTLVGKYLLYYHCKRGFQLKEIK